VRIAKNGVNIIESFVMEWLAAFWHMRARVFGFLTRSALVSFFPHVKIGKGLKCYNFPKITHATGALYIGDGCSLGKVTLFVTAGAELIIGDNVSINDGCIIGARNRIEIGEGSMIAEYVTIRDADHGRYDILKKIRGNDLTAPIKIGAKVWIGRGVCVLRGAVIGDGATIGANGVVRGKIEEGSVAVGIPAKTITAAKQGPLG
jgi:acetyltransferase-like isoleucine patch superfamily enzyme